MAVRDRVKYTKWEIVMKKAILAFVVAVALAVGCMGCVEYMIGAGVGAAMSQMLDQSEAVLTENIDLMEAENAELVTLLETAESEADRKLIVNAIAENKQLIVRMKDSLTAVRLGRQGVNTNWNNPQSVGAFGAAAASALLAVYFRKRGLVVRRKYQSHKQGVNRIALSHPELAEEMYKTIGEERAKVGV